MIKVYYSKRDNTPFGFKEPVRYYRDYPVTGQNADSSIYSQVKFNLLKEFIDHDTVNGVHIIFKGKSTYASLIRILNIFKQEKWVNYCISDHKIWAWYEEPMMMGTFKCFLCDCIQESQKDPIYAQVQKENKYKNLVWVFWPVWSLLVIMMINKIYSGRKVL